MARLLGRVSPYEASVRLYAVQTRRLQSTALFMGYGFNNHKLIGSAYQFTVSLVRVAEIYFSTVPTAYGTSLNFASLDTLAGVFHGSMGLVREFLNRVSI